MLVDGKALRDKIKQQIHIEVDRLGKPVCAAVIIVGSDPVTERFVTAKEQFARDVGITLVRHTFDVDVSEEVLSHALETLAQDISINAIIVQLPLPHSMNASKLLNMIPIHKDADMLSALSLTKFRSEESTILPPVAGAVQAILEEYGVSVLEKDVLVLGHGKLVGAPVALLMRHNHAHVTVVDQPIADLSRMTKDAEVIVSGVGTPGLITKDMITPGVVLIDAGTSESGGKIVGDIDAACALYASVMTPSPGGVGPVTVAQLCKNIVLLAREQYASNQ